MKQALVITAGTTGCGKTTVCEALCRRWPVFRHLEIDAVRKELAGIPATERLALGDPGGGLYSEPMSDAAYAEMYRRAADYLRDGYPVLLDAAFRKRRRRESAAAVGRRAEVPTVIVEFALEEAEQLRRLERRYAEGGSVSDARPQVLAYHASGWEPVGDEEADRVLHIDSAPPLNIVVDDVFEQLSVALAR